MDGSIKTAAICIQSAFRGMMVRKQIAERHKSAKMIQKTYRAYKQRPRHDRRDYFAKRRAVVAIQATFRGMQVRRQIRREHEAATIIQSHVRKHILKLRFQRLRWHYRAFRLCQRERAQFLQLQKSAVLIQVSM
uniref:Calmodulin binding transcription activator 2 n=1 Tax=Sinocyclocheilus rhinocerous TaxID=307959 RepID=A0A673LJ66_9TELE